MKQKQRKVAAVPAPVASKTLGEQLDELQNQYNQLCLRTGEVSYRLNCAQQELDTLHQAQQEVNQRAHTLRQQQANEAKK